ncbi:hypothetical protein COS77_01560 [Candidatus Roizmanbacteria bacterium CG06_land_8_20_14_3_00_34_14]|uniref:DUF3800 domain-containing protein n=2 Tax=Candidatus Roizmaniibacteriota TaxID=1752723 RepID=A0A2M7AUY0_9BACT|nr:MAG: hypothetical protein COT02_04425 [Candidatus Roizmanbacteria bacterium CG07_land_8_20_14_0_80_34_15]PIU74444.1 MAG: hypothetical protein COS77_01560 [Candidatus Roizmanbacteria bacterium CG06_land_8_20_14_3_00_34_14]
MHSYKILSIDESGKASYNHPSPLFIVSGIIMPENFKHKIDSQIRKLKLKYFKNEEIIFHSREMSRKKAQFSLLNNEIIEKNFYGDFTSIINNPVIDVIFIINNKEKAKRAGWTPQTILKRSYIKLLQLFIENLISSTSKGKIIVESDPTQDHYLIQAHNHLQSQGYVMKKILPQIYRHSVTSLSLVNKENLDVDVQIADALASVAGLKYRREVIGIDGKISQVDKVKLKLINRKLVINKKSSRFEILL